MYVDIEASVCDDYMALDIGNVDPCHQLTSYIEKGIEFYIIAYMQS